MGKEIIKNILKGLNWIFIFIIIILFIPAEGKNIYLS